MKIMMKYGCALAGLASIAHADLYEMVLSGQLTRVDDSRTSMNDALDGTVWDYDVYQPEIGDIWEYRVIFDTNVSPEDFDGGAEPHSIYGADFESTITLDGRTIGNFQSFLYFYNGSEDRQVAEIWGDANPTPGASFFVGTEFSRPDMVQELINDGEPFTSADAFDGLLWSGFGIYDNDNMFSFSTDRDAPFSIVFNQVPAPGAIVVLGGVGGLMSFRRR